MRSLIITGVITGVLATGAYAGEISHNGSMGELSKYPGGPNVTESNGKSDDDKPKHDHKPPKDHDPKPPKPPKYGPVTNTNSNEQTQGQLQGQKQGQKQSQDQNQSQSNRSVNKQGQAVNNGQTVAPAQSVNISGDDIPRQAPPAYAPALTSAPETCMGSASGGVSTPFGGISLGSTYKSEDCELRMFARTLANLGQPAAALVLLAQNNAKVAAALKAVGVQLPGVAAESKNMPTVATVTSEEVIPATTTTVAPQTN